MRPDRYTVISELGKNKTLPTSSEQYEVLRTGEGSGQALFLGLGPEPHEAASRLRPGDSVHYIEAPAFLAQMDTQWTESIPGHWQAISPEELSQYKGRIYFYRPGLILFPGFWGPILASLDLARIGHGQTQAKTGRSALVLAKPGQLMVREVELALKAEGFRPVVFGGCRGELLRILANNQPSFCLSLNFSGLDPLGRTFHLLDKAGIPVAVWCVDNPWNQLSSFKAEFWKKLFLFVTDSFFVDPLKTLGAKQAWHLPLGACPEIFTGPARPDSPSDNLLFVGRSQFPGKAAFFAGSALDGRLWNQALALMDNGGRPDFAWWADALALAIPWPDSPGSRLRTVGFGAEECAQYWRKNCLAQALSQLRLTVVGDSHWKDLLPALTDLRPPVDYYKGLADCYRQATAVLNLTSMLLPAGLTQRHFDVWTAGGFLLTDQTAGLDIFPPELVREITFEKPADIPDLFRRWQNHPDQRRELTQAWREAILAKHTCRHRLAYMLDKLP